MGAGGIDVLQWTLHNFLSFVRKKLKLKARSLHVGVETQRATGGLVSWDQTPLLPFTRNIQAQDLTGIGSCFSHLSRAPRSTVTYIHTIDRILICISFCSWPFFTLTRIFITAVRNLGYFLWITRITYSLSIFIRCNTLSKYLHQCNLLIKYLR
jgi:hypothetical protein